MAYSKTEYFSRDLAQVARLAKALAHPVRIRILQILADRNACLCGELVDSLPLSQSTVSQHLKELEKVGLIHGEIEGPKTCYCLNLPVLEKAMISFSKLFSGICRCSFQGGKK